jgi:predicted transposase YbfD/YdcC
MREEPRYFVTSLADVKAFAKAVRAYWGIENGLRWCLKDNSAENFAVIRHIALNIPKNYPAKMSLRRKRFKYADADFMVKVLLSAFS